MQLRTKLLIGAGALGFFMGIEATLTTMLVVAACKPTQEFVEAKTQIAESLGVESDEVRLYRHDLDSSYWDIALGDGVNLLSDDTGVYPGSIYTYRVGDADEQPMLASLRTYNPLAFGRCFQFYGVPAYELKLEYTEVSGRPGLYEVDVFFDCDFDVTAVTTAIDAEIAK